MLLSPLKRRGLTRRLTYPAIFKKICLKNGLFRCLTKSMGFTGASFLTLSLPYNAIVDIILAAQEYRPYTPSHGIAFSIFFHRENMTYSCSDSGDIDTM